MATTEDETRNSLCDFISRQPDELLLRILDKVPLADAIRTGTLSNRWRHVWKYISVIEFGPSWVESTGKDIVSSLEKFISLHLGRKIKQFSVKLTYEPEILEHIDSWVLFAVSKHVEDLHLEFVEKDEDAFRNTPMPCYTLPPCVFNSRSLVNLALSFCDLKLPPSCQLHSLQDVHFYRMELPSDAIYRLTVNSPLFEGLTLTDCNRTMDLHINVPLAPNFHALTILETCAVKRETRMEICAPTCRSVIFLGLMPRLVYAITNLLECSHAKFYFQQMFLAQQEQHMQNVLATDSGLLQCENTLSHLLSGIEAGYLFMCRWTIQVLFLDDATQNEHDITNCSGFELYEPPYDILRQIIIMNEYHIMWSSCLFKINFIRSDDQKLISFTNLILTHQYPVQLLSLRELRKCERLCFRCIELVLDTCFWKWELPGIIYMLKSCPVLHHLVIRINQLYGDEHIKVSEVFKIQHAFQVFGYFKGQVQFLKRSLPHLRTIEFQNCNGGSDAWGNNGHFSISTFFNRCMPALELIKLLKKSALNLQSIAFIEEKKQHKIYFGRVQTSFSL